MKTNLDPEIFDKLIDEILIELRSACDKFNAYHSGHEGYAVIKEELDELWDEIKADNPENWQKEAIQVAVTAIRFVIDLCYNSNNPRSLL